MKEIDSENIDKLKILVERKFGQKIIYAREAEALSNNIFEVTNRRVSMSTVKRMWGIVSSHFSPSKYTVDSLAIYVGFQDWDEFMGIRQKSIWESFEYSSWDFVKRRSHVISQYALDSIISRSGIHYSKIVHRSDLEKNFHQFLLSDKRVGSLIAPFGSGKSIFIAKLIEKLYLDKNAFFPNDIIWLVDYGAIESMITKTFNFEHLLVQFLGYDTSLDPIHFFIKNPELLKGRIVLIFDGLDNLIFQTDRFSLFIENLLRLVSVHLEIKWFKVFLSCRSYTWNFISERLAECPEIEKKWYNLSSEYFSPNYSNVSELSSEVIAKIVSNHAFKFDIYHQVFEKDVVSELIKYPFFLQILITCSIKQGEISELELLNQYLTKVVYFGANRMGKYRVISFFIEATSFGKESNFVLKSSFGKLISGFESAYAELLSLGILCEEVDTENGLLPDYRVRFSNHYVYTFLITDFWLKEHNLNPLLFEKIIAFYQKNHLLKYEILRWIVKLIFRQSRGLEMNQLCTMMENMFENIEEINLPSEYIYLLIKLIGIGIKKNVYE